MVNIYIHCVVLVKTSECKNSVVAGVENVF